jgi:hypothetical protein
MGYPFELINLIYCYVTPSLRSRGEAAGRTVNEPSKKHDDSPQRRRQRRGYISTMKDPFTVYNY